MAFAYDVWHVNAFGRSYQGAEQWTMGFWLGKEDGDAGSNSVEKKGGASGRRRARAVPCPTWSGDG